MISKNTKFAIFATYIMKGGASMATNLINVIKGVGSVASIVSMVCGAVGQGYDLRKTMSEAAVKASENKNNK